VALKVSRSMAASAFLPGGPREPERSLKGQVADPDGLLSPGKKA